MDIRDGFIGAIGNTPLIKLQKASALTGCTILGKAEFLNPGGSVKDRAALFIIEDAEQKGELRKGGLIVEGTAGNTGIGLALVGNARGYRTLIVIPQTQSQEKKDMLRLCGAELMEVPAVPYKDPNNYVHVSERVAKERGAFWANQWDNTANADGHYRSTGLEIWQQTGGAVTHFVAGLGTSGTFSGIARRLRELNPKVRLYSVQPDVPLHGIEGLKHMATAIVPGIYDPALADENLTVETDAAYRMVRKVAADEGLLIGVSSGAALVAASRVASSLASGTVVTVLPDSGERYLSESFWDAEDR
jgi:cysteine synthase A